MQRAFPWTKLGLTLSLGASFLAAACAHAPRAGTASGGPAITDIQSAVAEARGHALQGTVRIAHANAAGMHQTIDELTKGQETPEAMMLGDAALIAFGFVTPTQRSSFAASTRAVVDEQLLALYDPRQRALVLRDDLLHVATGSGALLRDSTIAHELMHAVQHETYPIFEQWIHGKVQDDRWFATKALFEGDAMVAQFAYIAQLAHAPLGSMIDAVAWRFADGPTDELLRAWGGSARTREAPALVRDILLFPYFGGFGMAAALYRTGGAALLDQAFAHPPASTEQVLHPEKYVAGELPVPVAAPASPPGTRFVSSGQLGELGLRQLLASCPGKFDAAASASDWGGDTYTLAEGADHELAVIHVSTWDTEAAAARFERAMRDVPRCWPAQTAPAADHWIGAEHRIARAGNRVVLLRGAATHGLEVSPLFALVGSTPAAAPPFGPIALKARQPAQGLVSAARFERGVVRDDLLGYSAPLPSGFVGKVLPGVGFGIFAKGEEQLTIGVAGALTPAAKPLSAALSRAQGEGVLRGVVKSLARNSGVDFTLGPTTHTTVQLPLGPGYRVTAASPTTKFRAEVTIIPTCDRRGAYVFTALSNVPDGLERVAAWEATLTPTGAAAPPFCDGRSAKSVAASP